MSVHLLSIKEFHALDLVTEIQFQARKDAQK